MKEKILVTCALPYSNGLLHIGHLLEAIQADIWVRFKKLDNLDVVFISSDDSHGTSIMLKSIELKINYNCLIKENYLNHFKDFKKFNIKYDIYHLTHSKENKYFVNYFYKKIKKENVLFKKKIYKFYDLKKNIFLSDRFITGDCKKCLNKINNSHYCNNCNLYVEDDEIVNPISLLSGNIPILKETEHIFFNINIYKNKLFYKINTIIFQKNILKKAIEWFKNGLKDWDISRDYPYLGIKIEGEYNKSFYVWFDALIGYISTFKKLCIINKKIKFNEYWNKSSNVKIYQFMGKDIIYFHSIFWLSILESINFNFPYKFIIHGHLTINNKKMSKSDKNFITAKNYTDKNIDTDFLRYFYASKLSKNVRDINFSNTEFCNIINNKFISKILNIPNRIINFLYIYFNSTLSNEVDDYKLYDFFIKKNDYIWNLYDNFEFSSVIKNVEELSDLINKYISESKPWKIINNKCKLHNVCTMVINLFKILIIYLMPIIPNTYNRINIFLGVELKKEDVFKFLFKLKINKYFITNKIQVNF